MKTDCFQSCGHCWVVQICLHIECSTFTASSFRIWNSSTGIPSPPLILLVVMLPRDYARSSLSSFLALNWISSVQSVQSLSHVQLFVTPWTAAHQASLFFTILQSLLQTHIHWVSDAIQPSHPLLPTSTLALNLSQHQDLYQWVGFSYQVARVF